MNHNKNELAQILLLMLRDYNTRASELLAPRGFGDIKPKHSSVLMHLGNFGPSRINDLAKSASIRPQSMVKIIDELENEGYVTREPDPQDSRAKLVSFTEKGQNVITAFAEITESIWDDYADIVGEDVFTSALDCLNTLTR
ncbi:putative HTH-type transcriptional regulator [BD1-7 clade bacterium]|uniref:Putative HTH-type transcriptional regulator n=1 Tax=BD1-7 clade bacterium TaxID=2029982 RepID=A0A5S9QZ66_9GAMM|nr:putative HTH-type transcriptional regulator [BD1-7 clade bacterium]